MLDLVGLDAAEEQAYLALLRLPVEESAELADRLGLAADDVAATVRSLEEKGFVRRNSDGTRLRAVQPDLVLGPMMLRRHAETQRMQALMAALMEEYRERAALRDAREVVEVVAGAAEVMARWEQLQLSAKSEVKGLAKGPVVVADSNQSSAQRSAMAAGVGYRIVYERSLLDAPGDPLHLAWSADLGEQMRIAADVPVKLMIIDSRVALLPSLTEGNEPSALVVSSGALLDILNWVFETVWASGVPFPATGATLNQADRQLLSLLIAGYTDQAIGTQMGLSQRTAQRRISRLIAIAGVETRIQLVWHAAQNDWL
ncbi:helix-turn-helix domain-containing protein [Micromonospora sp. NPDC093277]|uniref:helix-turn-helix domain-containing protein n=1 Tax=Micromonospora sp. NPDC093277 TaxID=3364291 RepID=UPI00382CC7C9